MSVPGRGGSTGVMGLVQGWVWLFVVSAATLTHVNGCPETCHCVEKGTSIVTICAGHNLTSIPQGISPQTQELLLKGNRIQTLQQNAFEGLTALRTLVLSNCGIETIEANAFAGLKNLGSLDLGNNKIMELEAYAFSGLFNLKRLELRNNQLEVVHNFAFTGLNLTMLSLEGNPNLRDLSVKAFYNSMVHELLIYNTSLSSQSTRSLAELHSSLRDLHWENNREPLELPQDLFLGFSFRSLSLSYNDIRDPSFLKNVMTDELLLEGNPIGPIDFSQYPNLRLVGTLNLHKTKFNPVHARYFRDMNHLKNLYLSDNGIKTLSEDLKSSVFDRLEILTVQNNPFHCNCELLWFKKWLLTTSTIVRGAVCATPKVSDLAETKNKHFKCTAPESVEITRRVNISSGEDLTLSCRAWGDPAPVISWYLPDGREGTSSLPDPDYKLRENSVQLTVSSSSQTALGAYKCVASNVAGNASDATYIDAYKITRSANKSAGSTILIHSLLLLLTIVSPMLYMTYVYQV